MFSFVFGCLKTQNFILKTFFHSFVFILLIFDRLHYSMLELFVDPSAMMSVGGSNATYNNSRDRSNSRDRYESQRNNNTGIYGEPINVRDRESIGSINGRDARVSNDARNIVSSRYSHPLPVNSLTSYGVLPETVQQLADMKAYLSRHVSFYDIILCFHIIFDSFFFVSFEMFVILLISIDYINYYQ